MDNLPNPLLATKLYIPPPRLHLVRRARLLARLDEAMTCGLILISAPAGFGKTTLLADWIASTRTSTAWVSLDEHDNDLARFFAYTIAALQTLRSGIGQSALALIQAQPDQPASIETALTLLLNDLVEITTPFVLVLDDYHLIHDQLIHNALVFILEHLPPRMHLILITRADPPFSVARLRVRNQLVELRAADLRFTAGEAAAFLNDVMGLTIPTEQIATLEVRTEGWIAGLQLAALSMQGRDDVGGFIEAFAGTNRLVLNYLIEEVLQRLPHATQEFLLQTSFLDRLTASLCDVVTGRTDSQTTIEILIQSNLFVIPLDDEGRWYRYHRLFADTLRARLQQTQPNLISVLHRRASGWFEQAMLANDAVTHAIAAHDWERASDLIEKFEAMMFKQNQIPIVVEWIRALPLELLQTRPSLALIAAWAWLATTHVEETEIALQATERAVGVQADMLMTEQAGDLTPRVRTALIEVTVIRASMMMTQFDFAEKIKRLERILPWLTNDAPVVNNPLADLDPVVKFNLALAYEFTGNSDQASQLFSQAIEGAQRLDNWHIVTLSISHLAQVQFVQGQLHRSAETYSHALQTTSQLPSPFIGIARMGLGRLRYEWNELDHALDEFRLGIEQGKYWNNWESLLPAFTGVAKIFCARGDTASARSTMTEMAALAQKANSAFVQAGVESVQAEIDTQCGDGAIARRWADASDLHTIDPIPYHREDEAIALARVLIALGRNDQAHQLIERLLAHTHADKRVGHEIVLLALDATATHSLDPLRRALELAKPEGFIRAFIDCGEDMQKLLARIDSDYAHKLLSAFAAATEERGPRAEQVPSVRHPLPAVNLSEREAQVLRLIADGLSNQEIADQLVISIRTVKKHIENIYGKLDAQSRTQAIAKAHELKLL